MLFCVAGIVDSFLSAVLCICNPEYYKVNVVYVYVYMYSYNILNTVGSFNLHVRNVQFPWWVCLIWQARSCTSLLQDLLTYPL